MRKILLLISVMIPLSAMAGESFYYDPLQEFATDLNLKYNPEFDFDYCSKNTELCNNIIKDKNRFPKFDIQNRASDFSWGMFWTLQALDILSTKEGLEYDCVKEMNPLLPKRPSTSRLLLHKGMVFGVPYFGKNWRTNTTDEELLAANLITAIVVINNIDVINGASRNCSKLR